MLGYTVYVSDPILGMFRYTSSMLLNRIYELSGALSGRYRAEKERLFGELQVRTWGIVQADMRWRMRYLSGR
jgi:hypothetical protein